MPISIPRFANYWTNGFRTGVAFEEPLGSYIIYLLTLA